MINTFRLEKYISDKGHSRLIQWATRVPLLDQISLKSKRRKSRIMQKCSIDELQYQLILKRDRKLKNVQHAIKKGLKSYSSVVGKRCTNCTSTLAPKKIKAAVKTASEK